MSETSKKPRKKRQRSVFGTILKKGHIYHVRYTIGTKTYQQSTKSTSRDEARRLLTELQVSLRQGVTPDGTKVTLDELKALVVANYKANGRKTLWRAEMCFKRLADYFGADAKLSVIPPRVPDYIAHRREQGAAPATVKQEVTTLKRGVSLAHQLGRIPHKPYITTLKVSNTRKGFVEREQLDALLAEMGKVSVRHKSSRHLIRPTLFAFLTGWRRGEVFGLTWKRIDFKAGVVRLEPGETKNGKGRTFPFDVLPELAQLLKEQRAETSRWELEHPGQKVRHVFWFARGDVAEPIAYSRHGWATACKDAGLEDLHFHDLRRSAARNMVREGIPQHVVMALLGHETDEMFRRYAIVHEGDLREQVAKLGRGKAR